ncbi:hypothetical protein J5N97_024287 [Dioscorea zingiberensis]|uniref:Ubiquitin-activating enzyme E1 C-terminal domain-containing protein n=1 Tax=Dioscorea zingiberensis TaxID=325984 RepID=A0A9D5C6N6_9LILI|nr:hypothetical protein J5N97_024287 [Dioscorea zingiberensis]
MIRSTSLDTSFKKQLEDAKRRGMLTITDDTFIEKSNLRQQFLFRDRNIGKLNLLLQQMQQHQSTPNLHIEAFQIPVRSGAEDVFKMHFGGTWMLFEDYFEYRVQRLTTLFPQDTTYPFGAPMWHAPKRFPKPFDFSFVEQVHISFVMAASILRAETFGIPIPDSVLVVLPDIVHHRFLMDRVKTAADLNPMLDHNLRRDLEGTVSLVERNHIIGTIRKLKQCLRNLPPGFKMKPVEFEKGDYKNYHMDFIAGLANLRARNYRIPEVDKLKAKVLSGRLIPLVSSTAALAAGFVCLELYKVLAGGHSCEDYCNSHANLVTPAFSVHKPLPPKVTEYRDMSWTVWDHWDFKEDLTLGELLRWLDEKHIHVYSFMCDGIIVYNTECPRRKERPDKRVVDMARIVAKVRLVPGNHLQVQMVCKDDQGNYIDVPPISISL